MVKKKSIISKTGFFLICVLVFYLFTKIATGFDIDIPKNDTQIKIDNTSDLISFQPSSYHDIIKRYIVSGTGPVEKIASQANGMIYGIDSNHGSLALGFFDQDQVSNLKLNGYNVIEDLPLEFDSVIPQMPATDVSRIDNIMGSDTAIHKYGYDGSGIRIGIVDTGTDFSNPDVANSLARDKNNAPVMIDADGQGIVLTNATFVANIKKGVIQNYTNAIPKNVTSSVYVTSKGVFLDFHKKGKTNIQVYNSLYPKGGAPVVNGTVPSDYKIGKDPRHFIVSQSGVYHFGMIYESVSQGQYFRLQLVPVLDVDGVIAKPSTLDKKLGAINGTLLPPLDPHGNFFGVMYDYGGHGTGTAGSIISAGKQSYDIYANSTKYHIRGVAPGAQIVPIKALWLGDAIYGWLWAAGFDQDNNQWRYSGNTRVDIISNSWGISTFPALQSVPGLDVQSLLLSMLCVPHSLDVNYPGVLIVSSAGNAGPGYGTLGTPDAAPFGITVGAVTDNVFVGYGPFKNQPRFGNSTSHYGEVSGFSSKGPSLIGDPKPDLMAVGEYSYTPTSVTKTSKNDTAQYGLFGGTSLAAPLVAGSAAILMESLKDNGRSEEHTSEL